VIRQLGEKRARDLLLSGRIVGAEEAMALGLANEVVPAENLLVRARELARTLAGMSPEALGRTKRLLLKLNEAEIDRDLEAAVRASADMRATADFREGLAAFLEKRPPKWSGS
jgi:methylglutaconyl-CoA hydratase